MSIKQLERENRQLKKRIQKIYKLIDTKIKNTEEDVHRSARIGMPTSLMYSELELLEEIKKELKGDIMTKRFNLIDDEWIGVDGIEYLTAVEDSESIQKTVYFIYKKNAEGICDLLNELSEDNEQLKTKYQELKYVMTHSEPVIEQKELQKIIYQVVVNMIEDKIKDVKERKGYLFKPNEADAVISVLNELKEELE